MAHSDARVLSLPHRVHFCGWVTTLPALQQAGWELSAEQDFVGMGVRIAMRHSDWQLRAVTESVDFNFFDHYSIARARPMDFHIAHFASTLYAVAEGDFTRFAPIDAMPQFISTERKSIDDFGIFATPLARTEEIIVDPHDVMALLERIKDLQRPEQAALRERNRARERRLDQPIQRQSFHAQILSIAA